MYELYDHSKQQDDPMIKHQLDDEDVTKKGIEESITEKTQDMEVSESVETE